MIRPLYPDKIMHYLTFIILFISVACNPTATSTVNTEPGTTTVTTVSVDPVIPVLTFDELAPVFQADNDTTYVINFWATWCKPCVAELPYFIELHEKNKEKKFKMIFVSLDFPKQIEKKLIPFLKKNPLPGPVVVLDDPDANAWIPRVHPEWSGAIPATYTYQGKQNSFAERTFHDVTALSDWVETLK